MWHRRIALILALVMAAGCGSVRERIESDIKLVKVAYTVDVEAVQPPELQEAVREFQDTHSD